MNIPVLLVMDRGVCVGVYAGVRQGVCAGVRIIAACEGVQPGAGPPPPPQPPFRLSENVSEAFWRLSLEPINLITYIIIILLYLLSV